MSRTVIIDVDNQYLHFSAAHFTIFSATERERLHGHNYSVRAKAETHVQDNGMAFDYNELKRALFALCQSLDEYTLLPTESKFLRVDKKSIGKDDYYSAEFNGQTLLLLQSDTLLLPVENISLEALGHHLIEALKGEGLLARLQIRRLELEVASGPGQRVVSVYER